MVYMAGDNDLEPYIVKDLEQELARPGSTANVQIVALADRHPGYDKSRGDWTGTKLYHVMPGMKGDAGHAVADWGERNLGEGRTLAEFVSWAKASYPAERYALYLWGHGWNWHPDFTMEDASQSDALDPHEVSAVQPQLGFIDLVAYDGCNMGSAEVDALWHGHATAIVHSQEYVGWDGIEYDRVLSQLNARPGMSTDELAVISNRSASLNQEKTGSAIAIDKRFERLVFAVDEWSAALAAGLPRYRQAYGPAFAQARSFSEAPDDKDLYDMARLMIQHVPDPGIQATSRAVMAAVEAVRLDEWHVPEYANAHGISLSTAFVSDDYHAYYQNLAFSRLTRWNEFLNAYGKP